MKDIREILEEYADEWRLLDNEDNQYSNQIIMSTSQTRELIKELKEREQQIREEVVRGFVEYMQKEYRVGVAHHETNEDEWSKTFADILQQLVDSQPELANRYLKENQ